MKRFLAILALIATCSAAFAQGVVFDCSIGEEGAISACPNGLRRSIYSCLRVFRFRDK